MTETPLKDRMARAIAAAIQRSLGDAPEAAKHPVMADRRRVAENAAGAALASIRPGDAFGDGLIAVRRNAALEPSGGNDGAKARLP